MVLSMSVLLVESGSTLSRQHHHNAYQSNELHFHSSQSKLMFMVFSIRICDLYVSGKFDFWKEKSFSKWTIPWAWHQGKHDNGSVESDFELLSPTRHSCDYLTEDAFDQKTEHIIGGSLCGCWNRKLSTFSDQRKVLEFTQNINIIEDFLGKGVHLRHRKKMLVENQ